MLTLHFVYRLVAFWKYRKKKNVKERVRHHQQRKPIIYMSLAEFAKREYSLSALLIKTVMFQVCTNPIMVEDNSNTVATGRALSTRKYAKHIALGRALYNWICNMFSSKRRITGNIIVSKALQLSKMLNECLPTKNRKPQSLQEAGLVILKKVVSRAVKVRGEASDGYKNNMLLQSEHIRQKFSMYVTKDDFNCN